VNDLMEVNRTQSVTAALKVIPYWFYWKHFTIFDCSFDNISQL